MKKKKKKKKKQKNYMKTKNSILYSEITSTDR